MEYTLKKGHSGVFAGSQLPVFWLNMSLFVYHSGFIPSSEASWRQSLGVPHNNNRTVKERAS